MNPRLADISEIGISRFVGASLVRGSLQACWQFSRVDRGIKHSSKRDLWVPWQPPMGSMRGKTRPLTGWSESRVLSALELPFFFHDSLGDEATRVFSPSSLRFRRETMLARCRRRHVSPPLPFDSRRN